MGSAVTRGGGRVGRMLLLAGFAAGTLVTVLAPRRGSAAADDKVKLRHPNAFIAELHFKVQGASACNGPQCHGGANNADGSYKPGGENTLWNDVDRHSKAYKTLTNATSKKIATALKITNAAKSDRCLSCHALEVPDAQQDAATYRIKDGVTCNSCHGPSEKWVGPHSAKGWLDTQRKTSDHATLLTKFGIYDTQPVQARAERCTSCHLGIDTSLVTAGHPQPVFDLAFYSEKEPKHWKDPVGYWYASLWAGGQAVCLRDAMAQLSARAAAGDDAALVKDAYLQALGHYAVLRQALAAGAMPTPLASLDGPVKTLTAAVTAGDKAGIAKGADAVAAVAQTLAPQAAAAPFTAAQTSACLSAIAKDADHMIAAAGPHGQEQQSMAVYDLTVAKTSAAGGTVPAAVAALPPEPGKPVPAGYAAKLAAATAALPK